MKIIFSVATYYPIKDGVQSVTQYQAEGLASRGHEVIVVTSARNELPNRDIHNGVEIIRVNAYNSHLLHRGDKIEFRKRVLELTKNADALVAVCLQSYSADWLLQLLPRISATKILYMHGMHDFRWNRNDFVNAQAFGKKILRNIWWGFFYKFQKKHIREFDINIHLHKRDTAYKYFDKKKLGSNAIIENSVDDEFFNDNLNPIQSIDRKYFISVANYDDRKNQAMLIETFYRSSINETSLILIGSKKNKYYFKLESLVHEMEKKYGHKEVKLLTQIERNEISRYVKNSCCYLSASKWEAYPISIIEAMATETPFISTDVGIVKFLPGGVIINNSDDLKFWMETLDSNIRLADRMGKLGKIYAEENLNQKKSVIKLEKIIIDSKASKER